MICDSPWGFVIISILRQDKKIKIIVFVNESVTFKNTKVILKLWILNYVDCNWTQTHNHLVHKRTWMNCWVFIYELSGCGFEFNCRSTLERVHDMMIVFLLFVLICFTLSTIEPTSFKKSAPNPFHNFCGCYNT